MFLDLLSQPAFLLAVVGGVLLVGGLFRNSLVRFSLILIASAVAIFVMESVSAIFSINQFLLLLVILVFWVLAIAIYAILKLTK